MTQPVLFLKKGCPYCMRVLIFLAESGHLNKFERRDDGEKNRSFLHKIRGQPPSFPALEYMDTSGNLKHVFDSAEIVNIYASKYNVNPNELPAYQIYLGGVFQGYRNMVAYLKNMNEDVGGIANGEIKN